MTTVSCPNGDKGTCTIPDHAAVVRKGAVSLASREEINAIFPDLDLAKAKLSPVEVGHKQRYFIERIDRTKDEVPPAIEAAIVRAAERSSAHGESAAGGVIVKCSCGHIFIASP